ncbi:hypothetical protein CDD83_6878 [Cordyceps sp. RAO-2017]|nr:hypothetical protein CDD83_6878 [Cordyceps sp. RAO-2017]
MGGRRLRYGVATSLDGFIASLDGSTDWIVEDSSINFDALYAEHDTFVMGRKTYRAMLALGSPSPLSRRSKESVIVVSRSMKPEDHPGITIVAENALGAVRELKAADGKDIWLMGGGQLAGPCLEAGLVDMIEVAVMPVVLGSGIKMVAGGAAEGGRLYKLQLEQVRTLKETGIIMTRYSVKAGAPHDTATTERRYE